MSSRLFNIDLVTGECVEEIDIDVWDCDIEQAIQRIREAAEGLRDARLGAEAGAYEGDEARIIVSGRRQLTNDERRRKAEEKEREARYRDYLDRFPG